MPPIMLCIYLPLEIKTPWYQMASKFFLVCRKLGNLIGPHTN